MGVGVKRTTYGDCPCCKLRITVRSKLWDRVKIPACPECGWPLIRVEQERAFVSGSGADRKYRARERERARRAGVQATHIAERTLRCQVCDQPRKARKYALCALCSRTLKDLDPALHRRYQLEWYKCGHGRAMKPTIRIVEAVVRKRLSDAKNGQDAA